MKLLKDRQALFEKLVQHSLPKLCPKSNKYKITEYNILSVAVSNLYSSSASWEQVVVLGNSLDFLRLFDLTATCAKRISLIPFRNFRIQRQFLPFPDR